jgi:predicted MPP superfamily phosphohydrolase
MNLLSRVRGISSRPAYLPQVLEKQPIKVYPNGFSLFPKPGVRKERLQFPEYTVPVPQGQSLKAAVRLLFLSDIHMDEINKNWLLEALPHIKRLIQEQKIDALLLGGDYICQGDGFIRDFQKWVESIGVNIPMIGIMGNHDYLDGEKGKKIKQALTDAGVHMLVNDSRILNLGKKGKLVLHGVDDHLLGDPKLGDILDAVKKMSDKTHLGIIHNPKEVEKSPDLLNHFPLILSGHTHGGQVVGMFHWLAQLIMKQRYIGGLYIHPKKKGKLLVGKGMGTGTILLDKHHHPRLYAFLKWLGVKKEKGLSFAVPRWWEGFSEAVILKLVPEGKSWNA